MKIKKCLPFIFLYTLPALIFSCSSPQEHAGKAAQADSAEQQPLASPYQSFGDYPSDVSQLDTTRLIPDKDSPLYLGYLIATERSRIGSEEFGNLLPEIEKRIDGSNTELERYMYHYLNGIYHIKIRDDLDVSSEELIKAVGYFEQTQDTSGIMNVYFSLTTLNINPTAKVVGSKEMAKRYYDKIVDMGAKSAAIKDKLLKDYTVLLYHTTINEDTTIVKPLAAFYEGIDLIEKHPQLNYFKNAFTINAGLLFLKSGDVKKAQLYLTQAYNDYKSEEDPDIAMFAATAMNLSYCHYLQNEISYTEQYLIEAIKILQRGSATENDVLVQAYKNLAEVQFEQNKYQTAWQTKTTADSLNALRDEKRQQTALLDVQTKYETQQKEAEILKLETEKKAGDERLNRIIAGSVALLLFAAMVSFFAVRLRWANDSLNKSREARDKLFSIIAHDLAAPIASYQDLGTTVGYLLRTNQPDKIRAVADKIDTTGNQLSLLLNNLLKWSLSQQGRISPALQTVNIDEFADTQLHNFSQVAELKGVGMGKDVEAGLQLHTDPDMLNIIIRNMLDNAIKNTVRGNPVLFSIEKQGGLMLFRVTNESVGLSDAKLALLQNHFAGTEKVYFGQEGTGLGIQLIREFSLMLGGTVSVEKHDTYITATLTLPARP